jgi:hypothetical protein
MAETKRRKKEVNPLPEENAAKYLSADDLLKCETLSRDVQTAQLYVHVEEQALRNMNLEIVLLQLKISKQKELLGQKANELDLIKKRYNQYMANMWPKYGIDSSDKSLGYDPETGLIAES